MNPLLTAACEEADNLIAAVLGARCPVRSRLSQRGTIANPAPRALRLDGAALAGSIDLTGSWFSHVEQEKGFLNFTLSEGWYQAAAAQAPEAPPPLPEPPLTGVFPAVIAGEDWRFAKALYGAPVPELCARQDASNPGWLVRYTLRRLKVLEARAPVTLPLRDAERSLLRTLARFEPGASPHQQADYLYALARQLWEQPLPALSLVLNRHSQAVLSAGLSALKPPAL